MPSGVCMPADAIEAVLRRDDDSAVLHVIGAREIVGLEFGRQSVVRVRGGKSTQLRAATSTSKSDDAS